MKKLLIILVFSLFVLMGCTKAEPISMIVPFGGPEIAQLYLEASDDYQIDVVQGPDPLVAAFGSRQYDAIFAGSNLGAIMFNSNPEYILLATIVWGSTFVVSSNGLSDITALEGKDIIAFGQNSTPDIILKHCLSSYNVTVNSITYVDSVATAAAQFIADPTKYVVTSEPILSNIKAHVPDVNVLDLQAVYGSLHDGQSYPQASVFIKADLPMSKVGKLSADLAESVYKVNHDREATANLAVELNIGLSYDVVFSAIPNNNLAYVPAKDAKAALVTYFNLLAETNVALIGGMLPGDDFYYGA